MAILPVTEVRATLPEVLDRVVAGEEVTITRHGRPVAVVISPDSLRSRRADTTLTTAESVTQRLATGRRTALSEAGGLTAERADELVAEIRAGRDR